MNIPNYPDFIPVTLDIRDEMHPFFTILPQGISEYTFAGLFLFRDTYQYKISKLPGKDKDLCAISGIKEGKKFFMLPCGFPEWECFEDLMNNHDYLKGLAEDLADSHWCKLEQSGYKIQEDRDNFDYLYNREDLATLSGRKFHKKRNLVNAFINSYSYEEVPLTPERKDDAFWLIEEWRKDREDDGDYKAAIEALQLCQELELKGYMVYVDGKPAAYTLGESLAAGKMFVVHFEKAINEYKGIYQFINKAFASILPKHYNYINREQDLGDEGLRQAKMTYRPCGFVKKYKVEKLQTSTPPKP
ncbi:DUF2156 domain-containing protein [Spirochaeta cellobiosiphila]|uniref:DUF2156 domain-containing protein n=1 Tax=Spirochaeta cellobiosiphila TaxID=504483 RepID=UPI000413AE19|nr:phosphatidylglycerol lysyltransferase domain-containing protein [Spirochaeta cellobiosiphila]